MGSITDYTYLGRLDDRAYLRYRYVPLIYMFSNSNPKEMSEQIQYVKLSELDKPFRDALPPTLFQAGALGIAITNGGYISPKK